MSKKQAGSVKDTQYLPEGKENQFQTVVVRTPLVGSQNRKLMKSKSGGTEAD